MRKTARFGALLMCLLLILLSFTACRDPFATDPTETRYEAASGTKPTKETEPTEPSTKATEPSSESTEETTTEPVVTEPPDGPELVRESYNDLFIVTGTEALNIRQEPSMNADVAGILAKNDGGEILDYRPGWLHIRSGGVEGYIVVDYTTMGEEARRVAPSLAKKRFRVLNGGGTVYTAPSGMAEKLALAREGQVLELLSDTPEEGFYHVLAGGDIEGYVSEEAGETGWLLHEAVSIKRFQQGASESAPSTQAASQGQDIPDATVSLNDPEVAWNGHTVCVDAGHQRYGINEHEPIGPGASETKIKLSTGTEGVATHTEEYVVNLQVALKLQAELLRRGYHVVMTRTTHDCTMSNAERALFASANADIYIRVHQNGIENHDVHGVLTYAPALDNPWVPESVCRDSIRLAHCIAVEFSEATGAPIVAELKDNTLTGLNWATIPCMVLEMGFASNPDEDRLMVTPSYQNKMAVGTANGIDSYFRN